MPQGHTRCHKRRCDDGCPYSLLQYGFYALRRRRHPLSVLIIENVELGGGEPAVRQGGGEAGDVAPRIVDAEHQLRRSEEHTSELQSQSNLVCRLLLEKKKKQLNNN